MVKTVKSTVKSTVDPLLRRITRKNSDPPFDGGLWFIVLELDMDEKKTTV
jgi:hypothetical protein